MRWLTVDEGQHPKDVNHKGFIMVIVEDDFEEMRV